MFGKTPFCILFAACLFVDFCAAQNFEWYCDSGTEVCLSCEWSRDCPHGVVTSPDERTCYAYNPICRPNRVTPTVTIVGTKQRQTATIVGTREQPTVTIVGTREQPTATIVETKQKSSLEHPWEVNERVIESLNQSLDVLNTYPPNVGLARRILKQVLEQVVVLQEYLLIGKNIHNL